MKRAPLFVVTVLSAFLAACGGKETTSTETKSTPAPTRKTDLGRPSLDGALADAPDDKARAALIHKWLEMKIDPPRVRAAVQKYVNSPDPDLAAAAKEGSEDH